LLARIIVDESERHDTSSVEASEDLASKRPEPDQDKPVAAEGFQVRFCETSRSVCGEVEEGLQAC